MDREKTYRTISLAIFTLVFSYFLGSIYLTNPDKGFPITKWLYGSPYFEVASNRVWFELDVNYKKIELRFNRDIKYTDPEKNEPHFQSTRDNRPTRWWQNESANNQPPQPEILFFVEDPRATGIMQPFGIVEVKIDGKKINIEEFNNHYLKQQGSLTLTYPMQFSKISNTLAKHGGGIFSNMITTILLVLFTTQLLLVIYQWKLPDGIKEYLANNDSAKKQIFFIDQIASEFSVPLGFLGTITTIWVALELSSITFNTFGSFMELLKLAVFKSVLGLSTKTLCMIRGFEWTRKNP